MLAKGSKASGENSKAEVDPLLIKRVALVFRAINHPLRQQLLRIIHQQPGITVTELYQKLKLEQSVASQHLCLLREAQMLSTEREGRLIHYFVNHERLKKVHSLAKQLLAQSK